MKRIIILALGIAGLICYYAWADEEMSNPVHVKSGTGGRCYAKAIPSEGYGSKGITKVYQVGKEKDMLLVTIPLYSQDMYIQCNMVGPGKYGVSTVFLGPWARGHVPSKDHLAMAFYFDNKLLRKYSTLDIAGNIQNAKASIGHYRVIETVKGYRWIDSNDYAFDIVTVDGRTLSFNPATGERIK